MTDHHDAACDQARAAGPELALGLLDGRDRADVLAHVDGCPACRRELAELGQVADGLASLAPPAEPPPGFETRVLDAIGTAAPVPSPSVPVPTRRRVPPVLLGAVAAVAAVAIGLGGWAVGRHSGPGHPTGSHYATAADLMSPAHRNVGEVLATGGPHPWIAMAVHTGLGDATVECVVHRKDGGTTTVGTFALVNGSGWWSADVPGPAGQVDGAELVAGGRVVARAGLDLT